MLQPVNRVGQFYNPGDFIAILCEGQFARKSEGVFKLGTPVSFPKKRGTVHGVISGHNPNDVNRVRVSYFDRVNWIVRHEWRDKDGVTVIESTTASH